MDIKLFRVKSAVEKHAALVDAVLERGFSVSLDADFVHIIVPSLDAYLDCCWLMLARWSRVHPPDAFYSTWYFRIEGHDGLFFWRLLSDPFYHIKYGRVYYNTFDKYAS